MADGTGGVDAEQGAKKLGGLGGCVCLAIRITILIEKRAENNKNGKTSRP